MKRINNTQVWTDGIKNYVKDVNGEWIELVDPEDSTQDLGLTVDLDERILLKPAKGIFN
jgi:hypothetical protein